ncbi:MAG: hypothetical protein KAW47_11150 [Thermoplasmatales archaeon]|nr:hypothetical protein [Thermoplasmatales archaeon]
MKKSKTGFSNIDSTKFYFHEADAIEIDKILSNLPDGHIITITVDVNEGD